MAHNLTPIVTELHGGIAVLRFNKPAKRNPLSICTLHLLEGLLSKLSVRDETKVIIFTGTAAVFASGADLQELSKLHPSRLSNFPNSVSEYFKQSPMRSN